MKLALCMLMAFPGAASASGYTQAEAEINTDRWIIEETFELGLKPTGQDMLTRTKAAVLACRAAKPASKADEEALKGAAAAYNKHLNPAIHHVRNLMSRAIHGYDSLSMASVTVDINARLGKKSDPVSRNDPSLKRPGNFGPARPAERQLMDDLRKEAAGYGLQAHLETEKAQRLLDAVDTVAVSTPVAAALQALKEAVASSSAAAAGWLVFLEDGGKYAQAVDAHQRYLDAANAASAPAPEARKEAVRLFNIGSQEFARLEFMVGDDIMVGRNINVYIDDLGPL